jgi:hypothetical protein
MSVDYNELLPVQKKWVSHLFHTSTKDWPEDLKNHMKGRRLGCAEDWIEAISEWVKEQRD